MAAYDERTVTIVRHEYVLASPTHSDEIGKAVSAARAEIERQVQYNNGVRTDVMVQSSDDEIIIFWLERQV